MVRLQAVFALGPALLASSQVAARAVVPRESTLNVYLYEDVNNSGRQMIFIATDGGECRNVDWDWNDKISAIRMDSNANGWCYAYQNYGCGGSYIAIDPSDPAGYNSYGDLRQWDFNDQISSIQCYAPDKEDKDKKKKKKKKAKGKKGGGRGRAAAAAAVVAIRARKVILSAMNHSKWT